MKVLFGMTLREIVDKQMAQVESMIRDGIYTPHILLFSDDGEPAFLPLGAAEKGREIQGLRKLIRTVQPRMIMFTTEAWFATCAADDDFSVPPRERPDRVDAVFVYGETREGETAMATRQIEDPKGKRIVCPMPPRHAEPDGVVSMWNLYSRTQN